MNEVAEKTAAIETIEEVKTPEELEAEVNAEAVEEAEPGEAKAEEEEGEFVVSIGEDSPPQEDKEKAPEWVRELRQSHRETKKENRELRERIEKYEKKPEVTLGPKPKLDDPDIEYDEEKLSVAMDQWYEKKGQIDKQEEEAKRIEEAQAKAWEGTLGAYEEKKTSLKAKAKDFDDAESLVKESLSIVYQGAILQGSEDPALLMLALGRNPEKLKELSSIKDPAKFIFAVAKMEAQLKTGTRKAATNPEKKVVGTASGANATDATLAKLEEEAEKTGDRTKVLDYKRKLKQK
jgi:hypothetical protein